MSSEEAVSSALLFEKYCGLVAEVDGREHRVDTRRVVIEREVLHHVPAIVSGLLPEDGTLLLVCDSNTWQVAGEAVAAGFVAADRALDRLLVLEPQDGEAVADDRNVEHVREAIVSGGYPGVIAVGAGTVNDIAKMASYKASVGYAIVGTAPSMNGYTSAIAALLSDGVKTTQGCHVPLAVVCDVDVMAEAPYRMIASGLGDLLSKPVSNADWRLGARLAGAPYTSFPLEMIDAAHARLRGIEGRLPTRDRDAVRRLSEALVLSGMAMAAAGSSAPASGGEHLVSHYLDMVAIAQGTPHDLHGCQVGVGTIASAALYERLRELEPEEIEIDRLVARHVPWSVYRRTIEQRFAPFGLTRAVLEHAETGYPDRQTLRLRLHTLCEEWTSIMEDVGRTLETAATLRRILTDAEAPTTFAELGVGPELARRSLVHSKDIRARYTILHLAAELGLLETWADELLEPSFGLVARP